MQLCNKTCTAIKPIRWSVQKACERLVKQNTSLGWIFYDWKNKIKKLMNLCAKS